MTKHDPSHAHRHRRERRGNTHSGKVLTAADGDLDGFIGLGSQTDMMAVLRQNKRSWQDDQQEGQEDER